MSTQNPDECCPRFDPESWDNKLFTWDNKRFVQDRVTSLFHIPLNYGAVMKRNLEAIKAAGAAPEKRLILTDENSLWGADVYFEVTREIPNARMTSISGTFQSKVFEGSYRNMGAWIKEMDALVSGSGRQIRKLYFHYTTCPRCVIRYGKNYVVILAQV